ncbi:hypothetical protein ACH5RR_016724 [Cinchona calisaya]|uniref:Uncharacterized protein n=1 Tax=Cinchona calisaya TaxID=153742 RepID=A0ABD2ZWL4_9GENT
MEAEIHRNNGENTEVADPEENRVHDVPVDHKGEIPLRSSTTAWTASLFILVNLIIYFTKVLHQDVKTAKNNMDYCSRMTTVMAVFGAFVADAYLGRFFVTIISSIIYLMGLILLTMSQFIPSLKSCSEENCNHHRNVQKVIFFLALYLLSFGAEGHMPSLESFGADQFDDDHSEERKQKTLFFNWRKFTRYFGSLIGATFSFFLQDHVGFGVVNIILTLTTSFTLIIFYRGKPFYRFFDKAVVVEGHDIQQQGRKQNPWRLAIVVMLETTKVLINIFPIWFTSLIFVVCLTQTSSFFVMQSHLMDIKVSSRIEIPPSILGFIGSVAGLLVVALYEKLLVLSLSRRAPANERSYQILQRIGIGMTFSVLAMGVAALVERKRLEMAELDLVRGGKTWHSPHTTMSLFWLVPQYIISGIGESFCLVGLQEYYCEQVPHSMRSLGMSLFFSASVVEKFINNYLVSIVIHITEKFGTSWIGDDLNSSCLDKFYWLMTAIHSLNLCMYVLFAKRHSYKILKRNAMAAHGWEGDRKESSMA